jgi:4-amino-4-deoxy-L-arabinose transferase-like glycosyltransferase
MEQDNIEKRKNKIVRWLSQPHILILIGILILGIFLRVQIFNQTSDQALWWDEAEYMAKAKKLAFGWEWTDYWNSHKPILLSFLAVPFFWLGIGEIGIRFLILLISIAAIPAMYLAAKEFFNNRNIGLISAFLMAIFWVHLFFTGRILVGLPATTFFILFWYFFTKGFIKKQGSKYLYLAWFMFGLGFMLRVVYGALAIPIVAYMLFEDKLKILKKKETWISILVLLLTISPLIIWLFVQYPADPIGEFMGFKHERFEAAGGAMGIGGFPLYFLDLPYVLGWPLLIIFILGAPVYFIDLFLGFDMILKPERKDLRTKLFVLGFIIFAFLLWGYTRAYVEQRDAFTTALFFFGIIGTGLLKIKKHVSSYNKILAVAVILGLLVWGAHYHITWGRQLTKQKSTGVYEAIKEAGLWIKDNSLPGDIICSDARKEMLYYTEREVFDPDSYDYRVPRPVEEAKKELIENKNIKFIELDPIEKNDEWFGSWLKENQDRLEIARVWYADVEKTQPITIVYKLKHSNPFE